MCFSSKIRNNHQYHYKDTPNQESHLSLNSLDIWTPALPPSLTTLSNSLATTYYLHHDPSIPSVLICLWHPCPEITAAPQQLQESIPSQSHWDMVPSPSFLWTQIHLPYLPFKDFNSVVCIISASWEGWQAGRWGDGLRQELFWDKLLSLFLTSGQQPPWRELSISSSLFLWKKSLSLSHFTQCVSS